MSVIANCKPKMPASVLAGPLDDILAAADQLDYRKRKIGKMIGVGSTAFFEKSSESRLVGFGWKILAVPGCDPDDAVPTFGRFYDSAERDRTVGLEKLSHLDVSSNHEILDQLACGVWRDGLDAFYLAIDNDGFGLDRFELKRSLRLPVSMQPLRGVTL